MKRLLAALLLVASPALAQTNGWQEIQNGWSEIQTVPPAPGSTHAAATDVTTFTGSLVAKNLTASGLATPGAITVTPVLTQAGLITVVAGSALVDGDGFVVRGSGSSVLPLEFDLDPGDGTTGGAVPILFTGSETATQIRDLVVIAVNGGAASTHVTATAGGADTVVLSMTSAGLAGGTNTEAVTDAGFLIAGMADPTAATTYTYKLVARLPDGTTTEAGAASTTAAGYATLSAANRNSLSWSAVTGAVSYDVYRTAGGATQGKILSASTAGALNDTGLAGGGETAPTVDGTGVLRGDGLRIGTSATAGYVLTADAAGNYTPQAGGGTPATCVTAGMVPIFLGSPVALGCDAGLTYDAATDALTTGRILVGDGSAAAPSVAFASSPLSGLSTLGIGAIRLWHVGQPGAYFFSTGIPFMWLPADNAGIHFGTGEDAAIEHAGYRSIRVGRIANATPVANTLIVGESGAGTDIAGANGVIQSGAGTGSGAGSTLEFKTPNAHGSDAVAQTMTTRMTVNAFGVNVVIPAYADNTAAIAVIPAGNLYYTDVAGEYIVKVAH